MISHSIEEIVHRVERATSPDRELDALISTCIYGNDWTGIHPDWLDDEELPRYTASLDGALMLLPEGQWYWAVKQHPNGTCTADIGGIYLAEASNPALAFSAAALRSYLVKEPRQ